MSARLTWGLAGLLAVACSPARPATPEAERLVLGYSALRISLPLFVAEQRGLFRAHGLDVQLRRYETAQPLVEEVLDGRVVAGGFAALPIVFNASARDGARVRIALAMIEDEAHPVSYLLRRRGDSSIGSASDLTNRRVGVLPTIAYRRWLETILRHAGVDPADVTIIPIAPPQQTAALAGGGIDALFTNDPMATATLAASVGEPVEPAAPVPAATGGDLVFGSLLIHPRLVRERPETARRLLAALDDAIGLIDTDQAAARRTMTAYVRAAERPYVAHYPDARYLPSARFGDLELSRAVRSMVALGVIDEAPAVEGWTLRAALDGERGR